MTMEMETDSRASLEYLPSRQRDGFSSSSCNTMAAPLINGVVDRLPDVPRYTPSLAIYPDSLNHCQPSHLDSTRPAGLRMDTANAHQNTPEACPEPVSVFKFTKNTPKLAFNLEQSVRPLPRGVKRRRGVKDVDGPNTADLCCKKRRLRADLITSRLSQPFSQPATHILNREGAESGDKRFLKMATSVDAVRRIAHLHATSFLRFSVMNRIRKRLGVSRPGFQPQRVSIGSQAQGPQPREVEATNKAPWKPQSLQVASGATFWQPTGVASTISPSLLGQTGERSLQQGPKMLSPALPRVSKPTALPLPASDVAATKQRTDPRIHSVPSPELWPDAGTPDDAEEDSFAFLHPELEDYGDDDPEHVYSDFGAIFRSGSPDAQAGDEHSYEEYLDELDGISWATR